ncbi:MAG: photosynthetic reaction center cytochrome c subunit [Acidobacteria bacterium]|nr:photosynthetic reaction center cytochrome c subunit [Acidobacteriota bacterium]
MRFGSRRAFLGATAIAVLYLLGMATWRTVHAQNPPERVPLTEEVFKSVVLLRGIPVDTFFEAMGMFASAMGNDCTFCHASGAYFDKAAFAQPTPRIMKARQMIVMMNAINKQYFGGQPRVTCFTCHSGSQSPKKEPDLAVQYGPPLEDPNAMDFPVDARFSADQVFDKYLQALGGAGPLAKLTTFAAKGTYTGFDTVFEKVPVELFGKAPAQQAMIVHMFAGNSFRTFDGRSGWMAGPDTPLQLLTLTGGNLDRARLEATLLFPAGIRQAFSQWRVGRTAIDGREVQIVQGLTAGRPSANFYFDEDGLLVRMVRWTETPVGSVPTQIDYADYRNVAGVKVPFRRTVSQTYMQMTLELTDVQPNAQIDAARFAKPAPAPTPRIGA